MSCVDEKCSRFPDGSVERRKKCGNIDDSGPGACRNCELCQHVDQTSSKMNMCSEQVQLCEVV